MLVFGRIHVGPQLVCRGPKNLLDVFEHGLPVKPSYFNPLAADRTDSKVILSGG